MIERRKLERTVVTKNCGGNSLAAAVTNSGNRPNSRDAGEVDARRSPEQNAIFQGVPIEHIAHLPKSHQFTLIGNSVPPLMAEGIVRQVLNR